MQNPSLGGMVYAESRAEVSGLSLQISLPAD